MIARLTDRSESEIKAMRHANGIRAVYKMVDTCAAEFEASTPYYYSVYGGECEACGSGISALESVTSNHACISGTEESGGRAENSATKGPEAEGRRDSEAGSLFRENAEGRRRKVLVLGSGPIRIGQGIEFDYCSVHATWAFSRAGYETIIINNNPETVSTDFDIADKLYFEP